MKQAELPLKILHREVERLDVYHTSQPNSFLDKDDRKFLLDYVDVLYKAHKQPDISIDVDMTASEIQDLLEKIDETDRDPNEVDARSSTVEDTSTTDT